MESIVHFRLHTRPIQSHNLMVARPKSSFFYLLFTCLLLLWPCWGRSNSNRIAYHSASPLASTKAFFFYLLRSHLKKEEEIR
jgi:hypothetical protein